MAVIAVFVVAVAGISFGLAPLVYYYGEDDGLFYVLVINGLIGSIFTLSYHVIVNETLPVFMHKLGKLNPVAHIIAPSVATIIIVIAIYYSLIDLTWPESSAYIILPALIILALIITYSKRKSNIGMDTMQEEDNERRARHAQQ